MSRAGFLLAQEYYFPHALRRAVLQAIKIDVRSGLLALVVASIPDRAMVTRAQSGGEQGAHVSPARVVNVEVTDIGVGGVEFYVDTASKGVGIGAMKRALCSRYSGGLSGGAFIDFSRRNEPLVLQVFAAAF